MSLIVRNDEQVQVGTTVGLVAGSSSFTFDGSSVGVPDYRGYEIVISEISGRGVLIRGVDYSWNSSTGIFTLLQVGDIFQPNTFYNVHFEIQGGLLLYSIVAYGKSIIDESFFIRDITIPNTSNEAVLERLTLFIEKYEPECLKKIFGYKLYKLLKSEVSQRMTDIIFGTEYTDTYGNLCSWQGLVHDVNISLIANYVYFFFQEASATQTTGVSTSISKTESGTSVSPYFKMQSAWNFFSKEVNDLIYFLRSQSDVYPEISDWQFSKALEFSRPITF
jgi:hypothetical protein